MTFSKNVTTNISLYICSLLGISWENTPLNVHYYATQSAVHSYTHPSGQMRLIRQINLRRACIKHVNSWMTCNLLLLNCAELWTLSDDVASSSGLQLHSQDSQFSLIRTRTQIREYMWLQLRRWSGSYGNLKVTGLNPGTMHGSTVRYRVITQLAGWRLMWLLKAPEVEWEAENSAKLLSYGTYRDFPWCTELLSLYLYTFMLH